MNNSPFNLNNSDTYLKWRKEKLKPYPHTANTTFIKNILSISNIEKNEIINNIKKYNIAFYKLNNSHKLNNKNIPLIIAKQFMLKTIDLSIGKQGLSSIKKEKYPKYIPYTEQTLNWHTDGYYNKKPIQSFIIHCEKTPLKGGKNTFFDNDIAYILLRDQNINYIKILMEKDVIAIPANIQNNITLRQEISSPVFSIINNKLHMRYTERKINIKWKENPTLQKSLISLKNILNSSPYKIEKNFEENEGFICNNILHKRETFINDAKNKRLIHRLRFLTRIN